MPTYTFINATKDALDAIRKAKTLSIVKNSPGNIVSDFKLKDEQTKQEEYYPFKIFTDGEFLKVYPGELELDYNSFNLQIPYGALSEEDMEYFEISGNLDLPIPISSFE